MMQGEPEEEDSRKEYGANVSPDIENAEDLCAPNQR